MVTVFQKTEHYATSFVIYDGDTDLVIDSTFKNEESKLKWVSELARGDGTHYRTVSNMKAKMQLHYRGGVDSEWIELDSYDQTAINPVINECEI